MSNQQSLARQELLKRLMYYFHPGVLAVFYNQSDKYRVETDDFSGHVQIRDSYRDLSGNTERRSLDVMFGFRVCKNGEWAIAVYGPDLDNASTNERQLWAGFKLSETELSDPPDARFGKWVERYIDGNWDVEDGPIARLDYVIQQINAITQCVVSLPLFIATDIRSLCFPTAENTHRYHDAHSEAYKFLQDALSKAALDQLGGKLGIPIKSASQRTVEALKQLLPKLLPEPLHADVIGPLEVVSKNRRLADHSERSLSTSFPAFETFSRDMEGVVRGMETLRDSLARQFNVDIESCEKRAEAMKFLPTFDESRSDHGMLSTLQQIQGKQVVGVRAGYRTPHPEQHDSQALILEFSDGSLLGIDALTNITQIIGDEAQITPEALHVTFDVTYVPPVAPAHSQP